MTTKEKEEGNGVLPEALVLHWTSDCEGAGSGRHSKSHGFCRGVSYLPSGLQLLWREKIEFVNKIFLEES